MAEFIAENEAVKMNTLIKSGAFFQPAFCKAILHGDLPALDPAVKRLGSSEGTRIPAKKTMPMKMSTIR